MNAQYRWRRYVTVAAITVSMVAVACTPAGEVESDATVAAGTPAPTRPVRDSPAAASDSGANPSAGDTTTLAGVSVAVIGDSLTLSAHQQILDAFATADAEVVAFDALDGRRMVQGTPERPGGLAAVDTVLADPSVNPDVWVIALGTNDVAAQIEPDRLTADISAILEAVNAPVVWVDVFVGAYTQESAEFGQLVRTAAAQQPKAVVGDWFHEALDLDPLVDDQVHLTDAGKDEFAALMVDGVRLIEAQA